MQSKDLNILGLAKKAGKISWHEDANLSAIRMGRAKLMLLADDAGKATAKRYLDKCAYYEVPLIRGVTKDMLGTALGTSPRSAVAILDDGFAQAVLKRFTS